ncbi:MAG: multicopper oxidase family protein [Nitrospirota bacterium]|nr:multicopper oxidase family protein [Nitrospirota bacterium]
MRELDRREFLKTSALATAGGLFYAYGGVSEAEAQSDGHMGHMSPRTAKPEAVIIDPPPGGAYIEPPEMPLTRNGNELSCLIDTRMNDIDIAGTKVNLMTYNGHFPGQTIRAKRGDILKVHFKNNLPKSLGKNMLGHDRSETNLHTHGWHVSPSGKADNILLAFHTGEEHHYEYDLSHQAGGAMSYYHPHIHGTVADQVWNGLSGGALIVEDETPELSQYETHILMIKDITLHNNQPAPYKFGDYHRGKKGHTIMVNGLVHPVMSAKPGQVIRLRVLNACQARFIHLSLDGHQLQLIGTDSGLLDKPYSVNRLLMSSGERVDLLVKVSDKPGAFKMYALPYGNMPQMVTLMTLDVKGTKVNDQLPAKITSWRAEEAIKLRNMDIRKLKKVEMYFSFIEGEGAMNFKVFDHEPYIHTSKVDTYELWVIKAEGAMDHPFHQHVNPGLVLSITGGDPDYARLYSTIPGLKDTINVPPGGTVTMLMPIRHYTGTTVFHCHILEHEDIGMVGIWKIE